MNNSPPAPGSGAWLVQETIAQSVSTTTSIVYVVKSPPYARNLAAYWTIHSFPGSASTTLNIAFLATDPNGATYSINSPSTARSATGTTAYCIGQDIIASGNSAVNWCIPRTMTINISISAGATSKDVCFSLFLEWCP